MLIARDDRRPRRRDSGPTGAVCACIPFAMLLVLCCWARQGGPGVAHGADLRRQLGHAWDAAWTRFDRGPVGQALRWSWPRAAALLAFGRTQNFATRRAPLRAPLLLAPWALGPPQLLALCHQGAPPPELRCL